MIANVEHIQVMVDEEIAPNLTSAVQNHFQAIKMKQGKVSVYPRLPHKYKKKPLKPASKPLLLFRLGRAQSFDPPPVSGDSLEKNLGGETA